MIEKKKNNGYVVIMAFLQNHPLTITKRPTTPSIKDKQEGGTRLEKKKPPANTQ